MAKYQQYDEYKDSGVEWLGEIPKDWKAIKVKYIADTVSTGGTPKDLSSFTLEPEVCWFTPGDFHDGQILRQANKYVTWKSVNTNDAKIYKENSVLVIGIGATLGKVAHCSIPFSCNQQINVITPNSNISSFFLMYSLLVQDEQMSLSSNASTIGIMNQEKTKDILLALPSLKEQKTVTNFLDYQTAQIDTLIDKQQTLIQLLKEKRQAVISHAVTKGLNPDAPMKDSGVEWLGEVPEHWEVSKLGYISRVVRGGSPRPAGDPLLFNGSYSPWVTVAEITKDNKMYLQETSTFLTKKGSDQCRIFKTGTLVLSNSGATLGVPKILSIDANANDGVVGFESLQLNSEYVYFYLTTLTTDLRERIKQGSGQPNLNTDIVKELAVLIPPLPEITSIVSNIKRACETYDDLVLTAEQAIQLMQERRTALISAAVTGKIDVSGWVESE